MIYRLTVKSNLGVRTAYYFTDPAKLERLKSKLMEWGYMASDFNVEADNPVDNIDAMLEEFQVELFRAATCDLSKGEQGTIDHFYRRGFISEGLRRPETAPTGEQPTNPV